MVVEDDVCAEQKHGRTACHTRPSSITGIFSLSKSFTANLCNFREFIYPIWQGMKTARQLLTVVLLLVSYLAPAMVCTVSDAQMPPAERACCKMMKNQCEQMGMSASSGCCRTVLQDSRANAVYTKVQIDRPIPAATLWLGIETNLHPATHLLASAGHPDSSPPQSPPSSISILRI